MSDHRTLQRLASAMSRLQFEQEFERRRREAELGPLSGGDVVQHVQLTAHGKVGREPTYLDQTITFPMPFLMRVARTQTEGPLDAPHFSSGVEMTTDGHVFVDTQVRRWLMNDSQHITGAVIQVAVWSPDAPKLTTYSTIVHLTFSGFAAPAEDDSEG